MRCGNAWLAEGLVRAGGKQRTYPPTLSRRWPLTPRRPPGCAERLASRWSQHGAAAGGSGHHGMPLVGRVLAVTNQTQAL